MANTVTKTTLLDSSAMALIHVYLASDGAAGELSDEVLFDASALTGANAASHIAMVDCTLAGFSAKLEFDQTADFPVLVLPADEHMRADFRDIGLVKNPAGAGTTGDITITTSGFTAAGDEGHLLLLVKKAKASVS